MRMRKSTNSDTFDPLPSDPLMYLCIDNKSADKNISTSLDRLNFTILS